MSRFRITFHVAGRWAYSRGEDRRARWAGGSSSIRVSKATSRKLRALARDLAELHPEWHSGRPSLDELLDAIASGLLQVKKHAVPPRGEKACKPAIVEKHALSEISERACVPAGAERGE